MPPGASKGANTGDEAGDRLDWRRSGLSPRTRRVAHVIVETLLSDEDDDGNLVPGSPAACARAVDCLDHSVGRGSSDLHRGFFFLGLAIEWLPLFVIGVASRMTRLSLEERIRYLEALERSRFGLFPMLVVAFKVPLCIPAFEDGDELAETGFDRADTAARRRLALAPSDEAPAHATRPPQRDEVPA